MGVTDFLTKFQLFFSDAPLFLILIFFTAIIVLYAVFVFYFYRFMARKNIIEFNLNQFNNYEHPVSVKFFAILFYTIEYIILLPLLASFWFVFLSIVLFLMAEGMTISAILLISTALVASVRITAYISEDLSRDLAKMVPFTLAVIAITKPSFFKVDHLISNIYEIPLLLSNILYYLLFIIAIEFVMRIGELIFNSSGEEDNP